MYKTRITIGLLMDVLSKAVHNKMDVYWMHSKMRFRDNAQQWG